MTAQLDLMELLRPVTEPAPPRSAGRPRDRGEVWADGRIVARGGDKLPPGGAMPLLADDTTFRETLALGVPLAVAELGLLPPRTRQARAVRWCQEAAEAVGGRGDAIMFGARNRAAVASTFAALIKGVAGLVVTTPGGVDVAGLHWCMSTACGRCRPPVRRFDQAAAERRLEALDADYRRLAGLPAYRIGGAA